MRINGRNETFVALGSPTTAISDGEANDALREALGRLGERKRVLAIPPDFTRAHSRAGTLIRMAYDHYGSALTDILPALGTHHPMTAERIAAMYPGVPADLFRVHHWREDVRTVGVIPGGEVKAASEGVYDKPWTAQLNRLIAEGGHDLILSIGQVVPHEVTGMANHAKNLFVGCGGSEGINESHYIGAVYGMERIMGRADTPPRRLLNAALERFCSDLPILFVLTVMGPAREGEPADSHGLAMRGLFIGSGTGCFYQAAALSLKVNFTMLPEPIQKAVVFLNPDEYRSTWLGNKSIYRTRMALADGGELIVLAPGVETFGEDPAIDRLIRKYGYRPSAEVQRLVRENDDLRENLSAAAHLIHGSSEGRFRITYCPGGLSREEIESVGYGYGDLEAMRSKYDPDSLKEGWNRADGEEFYFIGNPAVGLWAYEGRYEST